MLFFFKKKDICNRGSLILKEARTRRSLVVDILFGEWVEQL
jgi:hypothetical protein